jgi:tetratricopeptide (TPR) repeat protein
VTRIARENGSAYSKVLDFWTCALAELTAADYDEAANSCTRALELIRTARVGVECEAEILAILAESRYRAGDLEQALADATATAEVSRERSNRVAEARALIIRGGVLARVAAHSREAEAQAVFEQARALIAHTGARILEASLQRERQWLATA